LGLPEVSGSRAALGLLPWLALSGLPAARSAARSAAGLGGLAALAPAPIALALALDHQAGRPVAELVATGGIGAVLLLLLALGARQARGHPLHAVSWWILIVGLPILAATLAWDGTPGGGVPFLDHLAAASPLDWAYARGLAGERGWTEALAPLAVTVGLALGGIGLGARRDRP